MQIPQTSFRRPSTFEQLEARSLLSVSVGSDGFTDVTKSSDSRVVYVSSSGGSDSNNGLSTGSPVKTLAKAKSLVRSGMPDHILLKKGDTWSESLGKWRMSGRNAQEPMLIGSYGTGARPQLKTGAGYAISTDGASVHDVAIIGLHFNAHTRDPESSSFTGTDGTAGLRMIGSLKNFLIEDNLIDNYSMNVSISDYNGRHSNIKIRRNVITDSYKSPTGDASGIYAKGVDGLLIEGNTIDRNGWSKWNSKIYGAQPTPGHNVYLNADNSGVVVKGNLIANGGSHGLQARAGGIITDNTFLKNPIGMSFGLVNGATAVVGGVKGEIAGNVFLDTRDIQTSGRGWGWAIEIANTKAGANVRVHHNVFAGDTAKRAGAIQLGYGDASNKYSTVGVNDLTIEDNVVYGWYRAVDMASGFTPGVTGYKNLNNLTVRNNDFQQLHSSKLVSHSSTYKSSEEFWSGNAYYDSDSSTSGWFSIGSTTTSFDSWKSKVESTASKTQISFSDPNRTIGEYAGTIGVSGSLSAFLTAARKLSGSIWDSDLTAAKANDYVRSGYGMWY